MQRITIYSEPDEYGEAERLGYFDLDAATHVLEEGREWNGQNMIGVISGMQINRAQLYRTSGGRWVAHENHSPEFNGPDVWQFLTDDEAREWMIKSGSADAEEALKKWFPDTPDESGPVTDSKGGRPSIGPTINVAYPRELLDKIEAAADKAGMSRAAWLRKIAEEAVA